MTLFPYSGLKNRPTRVWANGIQNLHSIVLALAVGPHYDKNNILTNIIFLYK